MGIRLLTRTTRSVAPTEAGERLHESLAPRIAEIEADIAALMAFRDKPSGTIRITLSDHALESVVWPKLQPVLKAYPDIKVELSLDSGFRNIVEDGFDAGVRLGESVEKDMIAVRIGPDWRLVAVASPAYFAERPVRSIRRIWSSTTASTCASQPRAGCMPGSSGRTDKQLRVRVDGQLTFNNSYAMIEPPFSGYGIAYVPEDIVAVAPQVGQA